MAQKIKKRSDIDLKKIHELVDDGRKESVTFQVATQLKNEVGELAKSMGYTRRKDGVVTPELTPAIVLLLEFGVAHANDYRSWVANGKQDVVTLEEATKIRKTFEKIVVDAGGKK